MTTKSDSSAEIKAATPDERQQTRETPVAAHTPRTNSRLGMVPDSPYSNNAARRPPTPKASRKGGSSKSGSVAVDIVAGNPPRKQCPSPIRELDRMAIESRAPPRFICPISGRVMKDPIILPTGTTCDRVAMEKRLASGNKRCPVTKKILRMPISLTPNAELRAAITVWAKKHAPWLMVSSASAVIFLKCKDCVDRSTHVRRIALASFWRWNK